MGCEGKSLLPKVRFKCGLSHPPPSLSLSLSFSSRHPLLRNSYVIKLEHCLSLVPPFLLVSQSTFRGLRRDPQFMSVWNGVHTVQVARHRVGSEPELHLHSRRTDLCIVPHHLCRPSNWWCALPSSSVGDGTRPDVSCRPRRIPQPPGRHAVPREAM